jgi:hypothetical protein
VQSWNVVAGRPKPVQVFPNRLLPRMPVRQPSALR